MAVATVDQVKTRIELLADACVATLLTGSEAPFVVPTLAAILARPRAATNERHGGTGRLVTRTWELFLFVQEVPNPPDDDDQITAMEACHPFLETVPDYFAVRPQLQDASLALPLVYGTSLMNDSGPVESNYKGKSYSAVRFTFDVVTMRP